MQETYVFTITGAQIASYTGLNATGNPPDQTVELTGVSVLGTASDTYTVSVFDQSNSGPTFSNGQKVTIYNPDGSVLFQNVNPQSNQFQNLAAGDEHMIFTINGTDYVIDLGGFSGSTVLYTNDDENAEVGEGDDDGEFDFGDACFTPGTLIRTPDGEVLIEDLRDGDMVLSKDNGPVRIQWVRSQTVDFENSPNRRRPILIKQDSGRSLILSPQHRVIVEWRDQEALMPAVGMIGTPGVREKKGVRKIEYYALMTPMHEVIWANGMECETFYPGEYILSTLPREMRKELHQLKPLLMFGAEMGYGPAARPFLTPSGKPVGNMVRGDQELTTVAAE